ncbi:probable transcription factor PosF21 [Citrus clementina]|uniref:probable transcription factor PosF21 n=1 Tax=Citrus clementina TaxID=85681 RepID=UPI000CED3CFB|nr:probable transcription factor PosF21 [Citrus x clementina]
MDKGKRPIQEEENLSSPLDDYHTNNMILPPTPLAPPGFSVLNFEGSGSSSKETTAASAVDDMDQVAKEDFFSKFLSMTVAGAPVPSMEEYSMSSASNTGVLPMAQADGYHDEMADPILPISHKLAGNKPPPATADDDKDKPLVFKKTMPPHELAQLAMFDPKRAKRIVANRMSAIRAKERKKLYIYMLEHKMHNLRSNSTTLTAQLTLLETESNSLDAEKAVLKHRLEITLQKIHLQDSLNDQIRSEIQHMKTVLGEKIPNLGALFGLSRKSSYQDMNAPIGAVAQLLPELQLQNSYLDQQPQYDFQQQPYLGLNNFGFQNEQGECSQLQQQLLYQENPPPHDHYQMQNEQAQARQLQQQQQLPRF